jgi:hypothetical protein
MPAAHIAPAAAMRVTPARNIVVSNRVISQFLRMAYLNCLGCVGLAAARKVNGGSKAPFGRLHDNCGIVVPIEPKPLNTLAAIENAGRQPSWRS